MQEKRSPRLCICIYDNLWQTIKKEKAEMQKGKETRSGKPPGKREEKRRRQKESQKRIGIGFGVRIGMGHGLGLGLGLGLGVAA